MSSAYWTDEREAKWERFDSIAAAVSDDINRDRDRDTIRLHASAPNPNGINADEKPDAWYWETGHTDIDANAAADLLADHVAGDVTVRERPAGWADGYWFVCDADEVAP
jgi:hypothetical protein